MTDDTFGLNSDNAIQPEPLNTSQPNPPVTPVTPETPTNSGQEDSPIPNIDKELEQQLSEVPTTETSGKKFPVKIVAIILSIVIAGGAAAYFFLGTSTNEQPPSFMDTATNEILNMAKEDMGIPTEKTDIPVPDGPPSLNFPSTSPDETTKDASPEAEELKETVDELKETSDAAANVKDVPVMEDSATPAEETPQKIAR